MGGGGGGGGAECGRTKSFRSISLKLPQLGYMTVRTMRGCIFHKTMEQAAAGGGIFCLFFFPFFFSFFFWPRRQQAGREASKQASKQDRKQASSRDLGRAAAATCPTAGAGLSTPSTEGGS